MDYEQNKVWYIWFLKQLNIYTISRPNEICLLWPLCINISLHIVKCLGIFLCLQVSINRLWEDKCNLVIASLHLIQTDFNKYCCNEILFMTCKIYFWRSLKDTFTILFKTSLSHFWTIGKINTHRDVAQ